ncbi:MAG: hypothetical protein ACAH27_02610 [Xanthobacteraceae bacterium]
MKIAIGIGVLLNAVLAAFVIMMSGYVFGGPEGMRGDPAVVAGWAAVLFIVLAAPVAAIVAARHARPGLGAALALAPPAAALLFGLASM